LGAVIVALIGFIAAFGIRNEQIFARAVKKNLTETDPNKQPSTEGENAEVADAGGLI